MTGVAEMTGKLRAIAAKFPDDVSKALYQEAQIEMTESKRRVPVDTGTLRASGFVMEPQRSGRNISVTMAYGGAAEQYAVIVHEDLEAHHPNGQAKYLESVIKESAPHMRDRIAARIKLKDK
jgi:hypothetical protein